MKRLNQNELFHVEHLAKLDLARMREHWPADYRRILKVFPYATGQADRTELVKGQRQKFRAGLRAVAVAEALPESRVSSQFDPATMEMATQ